MSTTAEAAWKPLPHPLRAYCRSEAELRYISNLGNGDDGGYRDQRSAAARSLSQQKRMASAMRDENGERISQDQQAAIIKAMQTLEAEQDAAFEQREVISEKLGKVMRKLGEVADKLASVEQDNEGVEQHARQLRGEIAAVREEREQNLVEVEEMRVENEDLRSRRLMACDLRIHKLRQEIRDTDRALKLAIWSSGGSTSSTSGVGAETPLPPLPPVEPLILAPSRQTDEGRSIKSGVVAPVAGPNFFAESVGIRKYNALADVRLKDVGEVRRRTVFVPSPDLLAKVHATTGLSRSRPNGSDVYRRALELAGRGRDLPPEKYTSWKPALGASRSSPALRTAGPSIREALARSRPRTVEPQRRRSTRRSGVITLVSAN